MRCHFRSRCLVLASFVTLAQTMLAQSSQVSLSSPDQRLVMRFATVAGKESNGTGGKLVYSITFRGKPLLDESALALELDGQPALGGNVQIIEITPGKGSDDYTLVAGKVSDVHHQYNNLLLRTLEDGGAKRTLMIEARAYNDGIAFRYVLPAQDAIKALRLKQEDTEVRIRTDATDWA